VIDIEQSISIASQKAEKGPKEAKSNYKQMAALEQKETIVKTFIKKRTTIDQNDSKSGWYQEL